MRDLFRGYRRRCQATAGSSSSSYRYVDIARKVVGVGSVGTRAWIVLLLGRDEQRPALPADQGGRGVGARAVPRPERVPEHGQRVVEGSG